MTRSEYKFEFEVYESITELPAEDAHLLAEARKVTGQAYAPYSHFYVGAVARLKNGETMSGSNQENASFPAGLCAERVLLATISSLYPGVPIKTMAISFRSSQVESNHPISPCGICRQSMQEYESRLGSPIRLILGGIEGKVYVIPSASMLLPLSFTSEDLGI